ncbi:MAG: DNA polymerase IV, partial [Myxococcales bacterium]|nr:DNA polymerase IV [Myxococcales bacterium]
MRQILHVDMDAFFASVEQRDDPALRARPVLVGGASPRGVVAAASYEARRFGCRSAMPMEQARRRCPEAIVCKPRMERYAELSREIFEIFGRYTPLVEGLSVDEAFLDVSGSLRLFGDARTIAERIKAEIREELQLTASAGVATSKFVAKVASDLGKPDGLLVVPAEQVETFLAPLPIRRMWGVGPKAADRLEAAGLRTIGALARTSEATLERLLGSWGPIARALARGDDPRPVAARADAKSVGAEETFERDLRSAEALGQRLLAQAGRVSARLFAEGLSGTVVTVKLKDARHRSRTRQRRLPEPIFDQDSIHAAAMELLERFFPLELGIRLCGVSVSGLCAGAAQGALFAEP